MIILFAFILAASINSADTAGLNASPQDMPVGEDPVSPPPRPRSRAPPTTGDGNVPDDEDPRPGKPNPIRPRPVPSAHDHAPAHPEPLAVRPTPTRKITPTNKPIM